MQNLEVIAGGKEKFKSKCSVMLENTIETFEDYVVLGFDNKTGKATLMHNADALTLAVAQEMIKDAFCSMYKDLSDKEREIVDMVVFKGGSNG